VLRASLQERRARREVRRVEGTKNEDANGPHDDEIVEISGATSDDFSTISPNFETNFTKVSKQFSTKLSDVAPKFGPKFRKKCSWFHFPCHKRGFLQARNVVMLEYF
jgi:hypothetical protein